MFIKNVQSLSVSYSTTELATHERAEVCLKTRITCKLVICYSQRIPKSGQTSNFPICHKFSFSF